MDTIFALATARGRAALATVRISGPQAGPLLDSLTGRVRPLARQAALRVLADPQSGDLLDQALVLWFPAPASATGEDLAELHLHGGPAVIAGVLQALAAYPQVRMAEAGEFARRAFTNDKMDLTQVEGLADLIAAETAGQRRQALAQAEGGLARQLTAWRQRLIAVSGQMEALLDFAEEEIPDDLLGEVERQAGDIAAEIAGLLDKANHGERMREGLRCALLGAPNVGKSSLLNVLAGREAAIVTDRPGTTRDLIEVHLDLGGLPVILTDTAGISAESDDDIEREGMRRALVRASEADLVVLLLDLSRDDPLPRALADLDGERCLLIGSKADLPRRNGAEVELSLSARSGAGVEALIALLQERGQGLLAVGGEPALVTRARQRNALQEATTCLVRARPTGLPELLAEDLRLALRALGRVAGRVDVEEVLDSLFREFCIGK
ncbi:MAG: tRNA uridine-5-carboxymethylaminomethyl(34) synthesis GTPase MnmE [Rhodospirillales bacterium]